MDTGATVERFGEDFRAAMTVAGERWYGYGSTEEAAAADMAANAAYTANAAVCDICGQQIVAGEKSTAGGGEVAHTACVGQWFRSNFGREGLG